MLKGPGVALALVVLLLLYPTLQVWAGYQIKHLTNNEYNDEYPQINVNGYVVWHGFDGKDNEIYLWRGGGSPILLTNNVNTDWYPKINDSTWVVWNCYDGQDWEIYYWPGMLSPLKLTDNEYGDYSPKIHSTNSWIVWSGYDGHDSEIYYWPGGSTINIKNISDNDNLNDDSPDINAWGHVVWHGDDGINEGIYYWPGGGKPITVVSDKDDKGAPRINSPDCVVWDEYDGKDWEIYLWQGSGSPFKITNNDFTDSMPQINNQGWVVWNGYDGHDWEIYLWKGSGSPINLTNNDYLDAYPQINNQGWVVWQGQVGGSDYEIFLWPGSGSPLQLTNNDLHDRYPKINLKGWIVWEMEEAFDKEIYVGIPQDQYKFKYVYGNGDYYTGWFYAAPGSNNCYVGWRSTPTLNESGKQGYYEITGMSWTGVSPTYYGQVYLDSYKDGESGKTYTPLHKGYIVGKAGLGSELDYILKDGVAPYKFGKGYYEADVGDKYTFRYYYGNGDYYQGSVYRAPSASGYYPGLKITKKNELGLNGYYEILSMTWTGDTAKYGQVYVDTYKDGESGKTFTPVHKGQAVGTAFLGSELDYILKDGVAPYKFGKGYYEADVGDKYTFRYYYGNGDYYQGSVYRAPTASGYYPGRKITKRNELGLDGYYEILSMTWTGDTAKYGQVYVDWYNDADRTTAKLFRPLNYTSPLGSSYLTSELGYIVSVSDAHKFGQGYWEADE